MSLYSVSSYEVTNIKILSDKLHMMEKENMNYVCKYWHNPPYYINFI